MIKVPSMGDSISSGEINEWVKKPGQACVEDEVICTIDTDKVSVEIRAPEAGVLKAILANAKDTVEVGKDIAIIDTDGKPTATPAAAASTPSTTTTTTTTASTPSTPTPTATPTPTPKKEEAKPTQSSAPTTSANGLARTERRVKMTRIRAKIAERLKQAQNTYAMLTTFNEIDMKKIMELRKVNQDDFQERHDGLKLGFMGAFCKAASIALTEVPAVNGVIDGNEVVYRDYVDISVAVATPNGLVVPVVRNCESKSIAQIERDISNLGEKARKNAISLDDMQGGTFTISNGGVFGSLMGTPIINPPQSAILGMHATKNRPIAIGDQVVVRPMMYVALTYDHRIIDGREAVTFLKRVKELIEDPEKMLLF
ncbi:dihydrolipoamide succinyltransferase [Naegleria gruberi]|uniref:dihydrolipoyllysine-residue succinyltransferase n=1 Tax=Naegleria gruberi TaxID=5762 RepID=D2V1E8_NAEGR|nr:dihydrolipoamide succinyltransferase [Naegleria gruberi]EFC49293.1 dihydrolipoamide succinyltransferase [Naegleria gruberi]|eukprot:XP_002682037.1 dihydrolipoamide succinyltransferase [Naegleria gruberi strain NEG-M]